MINNVIMWTESDAFERSKLIDALRSATHPVQEAMKHFIWEGKHLTCAGDCPKDHWRNLYFYLSGYGDSQFQECVKETKQQPVAIPAAPHSCEVCGQAIPSVPVVYRVNATGQHGIWRCASHLTMEQVHALGKNPFELISIITAGKTCEECGRDKSPSGACEHCYAS